ncbi:MAG: hypothetical protein WC456_03640 [Patescibacteria group bacterium]
MRERILYHDAEKGQENKSSILWKKYGFRGQPPKAGSVVEKRLIDTCQEYLDAIKIRAKTGIQLDSRITGQNINLDPMKRSDDHQRQLHNQISLMIIGANRSGLPPQMAEKISDFACELIYGMKLAAYEKILFYEQPE